jgi:hypothetical protein
MTERPSPPKQTTPSEARPPVATLYRNSLAMWRAEWKAQKARTSEAASTPAPAR